MVGFVLPCNGGVPVVVLDEAEVWMQSLSAHRRVESGGMVTKGSGFGWRWVAGAVLCAAVTVGYAQSSGTGAQKKKPAAGSAKSSSSKGSTSKPGSKTAAHHATTHHAKRTGSRTKGRRKRL